ncbi:MAG: hypothetical protein ACRDKZ_13450, partial [Actinomycetota bacterium]
PGGRRRSCFALRALEAAEQQVPHRRARILAFDLRKKGGAEVVPLVDDVATLVLDVWAHEQGLRRPIVSFAGV